MRLFDAIIQSGVRTPLLWNENATVIERVAEATPRYVLDEQAAQACEDLVRDVPDLFDPANPFLRMPAPLFWFESRYCAPDSGGGRRSRMGILVEASLDGRSGWSQQFSEVGEGKWLAVPIANQFDLDGYPSAASEHACSLKHSQLPHIDRIFRHIVSHPDPQYFARLTGTERAQKIVHFAEASWFDVPLILAFSAMLASPGIVDSRASDLSRLNRARAKSRKRPLLDHVEVSLVLGAHSQRGAAGNDNSRRSTPRLHYVRGHIVNRQGRTFWRSPHLRGDTTRALVQRNVRVTTASRPRAVAKR